MSWGAVIGAGAGLVGGFLQSKGGDKQQQAAAGMSQADRDFYEKMYRQSLSDNRANQSSDFGTSTWTQDKDGKWTQDVRLDPAEQARLGDYRQIAADRMANAKGLSANLPQGAMNWDAIGLGRIASAAGVQGGGNSDATADARAGKGLIGQPGWQRQNPLIGGNGRPMGPPRMPQMPVQGPSAGGGILGGGPGAGQGQPQTPPGPAGLPGGRQPYTPAPIAAPKPAPTPQPTAPTAPGPAQPQVDPNAAANFQAYLTSGHNVMTPEMFDHFGGDEMLKYAKTFDPNAKFTTTSTYGGEGGEGPQGRRLDFNPALMAAALRGK